MPPYTRQHWIPAVYLKQFSSDGANATRRGSRIWRLDELEHREVRAESQCVENHFYSATDPRGSEVMFQRLENTYGLLMQKVWRREELTVRDYFGLILMMLDLHCRNASYNNQTDDENIRAYYVRIHCLRNELLMGSESENVSDQELWNFIRTTWRVRLLEPAADNPLITSDNPAIWFSLHESLNLNLMSLPLTPNCCAIAYDSRLCKVVGSVLTPGDNASLNRHQVERGRILYSAQQLTPEEQVAVRQTWRSHERPTGNVDRQQWSVNIQRIDQNKLPDFLAMV